MNFKKTLSLVMFFLLSKNGLASTAAGSLPIITRVTADCTLGSSNLTFGNYDPITQNATSPLYSSAVFQIACTKGAVVTISLDAGLHSGNASGTTRAMSDGGGHYLSYELYSDSGYSNVWSTTNTIQFTSASSSPLMESVYGKVPAGQSAVVGNYQDTVTITASF